MIILREGYERMFLTCKQNFKQMKSKRAIRYYTRLLYLSLKDKTDSKEMEKIRLHKLKNIIYVVLTNNATHPINNTHSYIQATSMY